MALEDDLEFYYQIRTDLVATALNQFALIQAQQLIDVYPSYADAMAAATALGFEPGSYLIKQVQDPEPVETI